MTDVRFAQLVRETVRDYTNERFKETGCTIYYHLMPDSKQITADDVFIVWQCKALQNWKALAITNLFDGMYYELTLNDDIGKMYLDVYRKVENRCIDLCKG